MRRVAIVVALAACSHPAARAAAPALQPADPRADSRDLTERDGTEWIITLGPSDADGEHAVREYIVTRRARGGSPVEVTRLSSGGWVQMNPRMSGSSDWRFYLAADGTFRAENRNNETRGDPAVMTSTATTFRFDGSKLVPVP